MLFLREKDLEPLVLWAEHAYVYVIIPGNEPPMPYSTEKRSPVKGIVDGVPFAETIHIDEDVFQARLYL